MTKKINISILILVLALIYGCNPSSDGVYPEDLVGKKRLLIEKKDQLSSLQEEIDILKTEIEKLSPNLTKRSKIVSTTKIDKRDFEKYVDVQGIVASDDIVNVSSAVGGRITRVYVKEGQYVKRGATIAKIDMETTQNQVQELETSLDLAKTVYERQERLWKQNIGSEIQYLEAKANKERLEKSIATIQSQLAKSRVYAPISGVVDREYASSGEMAGPGSPIVSILNTAKVKVVVDLPESYLGIIKRGDLVDIKIPALNKELRSKVTLIGRTIDPANRTFKVEVNLNNKGAELKPNLLAEMRINELTQKDVIVVPLTLVQEEVSGKRYIYLVDTEGEEPRASKRYVEIGESYNDEVVIETGLTGDEILIVNGARNITENEVITFSEPDTLKAK